MIIDIDSHRPLDVLADRASDTLADWFANTGTCRLCAATVSGQTDAASLTAEITERGYAAAPTPCAATCTRSAPQRWHRHRHRSHPACARSPDG